MLQGLGRVGMLFLADLEPRINLALQDSGTIFEGLSGSWRGFNPIVEVEVVRFHGGIASDVHLELGVFESLFRNRVVASRLRVQDSSIAITRDSKGRITILGQEIPEEAFDVESFLRYSGEIFLGEVRVHPVEWAVEESVAMESDYLTLTALLQNSDLHRGQVYLSVGDSTLGIGAHPSMRVGTACPGCEVNVQYAVIPGPLDPEEPGEGIAGEASVSIKGLNISKSLGALWDVSGMIEAIEGRIGISATGGGGYLIVDLGEFDFPSGRVDGLDAEAEFMVGSKRDRYGVRINRIGELIEENLLITLVPGEHVSIEVPDLDLGVASELAGTLLSKHEALSLWIDGLKASGQLSKIALKYDLQSGEYSGIGEIRNVNADEYRGIPFMRNVAAGVVATRDAIELQLAARDMQLGFKKLFAQPVEMDRVDGSLLIHFSGDYLGLIGENLRLQMGDAWLKGGFGLTRPLDVLDQKLLIVVDVGNMHANQAKQLLPVTMEPNLRVWLGESIKAGEILSAEIAYHGDLKRHAGPPSKEIVMHFDVSNLVVQYEPSWPLVQKLAGDVYLTSKTVEASFSTAESRGLNFGNLELSMPRDAAYVDVSMQGGGNFTSALDFIRHSPLTESLTFVDESWTADGNLKLNLVANIPVTDKGREVKAELVVELDDAQLDMPDYGLLASNLKGSAEYIYPREVNSKLVQGKLFGRPATFLFSTRNEVIHLNSAGTAEADVVSEWLDIQHGGLVSGEFAYAAEMKFFPGEDAASTLSVKTNLEGLRLGLPSELYKSASDSWDVVIDAEFPGDEILLGLEILNRASGWWRFKNSELSKGSLGVGITPLDDASIGDEFVVTGSLSTLDFSSTDSDAEEESTRSGLQETLSFPWALQDLRVGQVLMDDLEFTDLVLQGRGRSEYTEFSVVSLDMNASYRKDGSSPPKVHIRSLLLPDTEPDTASGAIPGQAETGLPVLPDPLENFDSDLLMDMDLVLDRVFVGEENYGSWSFNLRRSGEDIKLLNVDARIKGLNILSEAGVLWQPLHNRTFFNGSVGGRDMADILPQWEYAPSIRSESIQANADVSWIGSPLNFTLEGLNGIGSFNIANGEFLDIEGATGPLRIFTLLNFSAVAKRFSGDFSDVFGKGIEFDSVDATVNFDSGLITFVDAFKVDGSSGSFDIEGTVDLNLQTLDNTMIVTLPVTKALPWYAAWAAVANPVVGLGILVGSKIIEGPLEAFSSARYQISGTIDDPKVVFDGMFTKNMQGTRVRVLETKAEGEPLPGTKSQTDSDAELETEIVREEMLQQESANLDESDESALIVQELK